MMISNSKFYYSRGALFQVNPLRPSGLDLPIGPTDRGEGMHFQPPENGHEINGFGVSKLKPYTSRTTTGT